MMMSTIHHRTFGKGLSLIELMIGMTIGLLIIAGVIQAFLSTKHAIRNQENLNQVQERTRFAHFLLSRSAMMSDHWGALSWADISGTYPSVTGIGDCDSSWIFEGENSVEGYDGQASISALTGNSTNPFPSDCLTDYKPNTDILVLRYADGIPIPDTSLQSSGIYLRTAQGRRGEIFQGSGLTGLGSDIYASGETRGRFNYPYKVEMYYIRSCFQFEPGQSACTANADNGKPIPTLMRATLYDNTLTHELLLEGIEQIQFEYGVDPEYDGIANCWMTATNVASSSSCADAFGVSNNADWSQISSIRISIVGRTLSGDASYLDGNTYNLAGGMNFKPDSDVDHYRRRVVTEVIQLRNRTRG